jgi:hypothetical protein
MIHMDKCVSSTDFDAIVVVVHEAEAIFRGNTLA